MTVQSETESWTIRRVLTWTQQRFAAQGLGSPRLDAELLLGHSLGWPRMTLYTHYDQVLEPGELERFRGLIKRRLAGEPVAYLIGHKEFYSLSLQVTEAVLIPRPETELLVDEALALVPPRAGSAPSEPSPPEGVEPEPAVADPEQVRAEPGVPLTVHYESFEPVEPPAESVAESPAAESPTAESPAAESPAEPPAAEPLARSPVARARPVAAARAPTSPDSGLAPVAIVADVGTGSGAVALAIKHSRPDVRVLAIDRCAAALQVATGNAERLGLGVEFFQGDLLAPLPPSLRLDLITANLPYIPTAEIATLAPEVRSEPPGALDGGPDGLEVIRRLVDAAPLRLRRGGALLLEIGAGQHTAVEALLRAAGFVDVQTRRDLAQIPRVVIGHLR